MNAVVLGLGPLRRQRGDPLWCWCLSPWFSSTAVNALRAWPEKPVLSRPRDVVQVVTIGGAGNEHVNVSRKRPRLTAVPGGPRPVNEGSVNPRLRGEQVSQHRQWPVRNRQQISQRPATAFPKPREGAARCRAGYR